mmetsp:Transcript_3340/g.4845  ORF Transcript_3340/g.4845 Transcript_3340/m.4845 type:complete len:463 (-) Transcript_3340:35-1423(-)|eukprot:CAMPEP_0184504984 /NCGR_PEP_ID=MMETSP0113_2-20130426/52749_1 /TAXON_ID=91329 /ORGANISM="Norrisiella sphaerica, Strain BC52" /LENGTH=462 /DNA_ID=CAMNT_0026894649 /DNA_START=94 /DNA_END=1482 /DNA_ORIENTATION=+
MEIHNIYTLMESRKRRKVRCYSTFLALAVVIVAILAFAGMMLTESHTPELTLKPLAPRGRFAGKCSSRRTLKTKMRVADAKEPWQRQADKLIDIDATSEERIAAVRNLIEQREAIEKDFTSAAQALVRDRDVASAKDILYPTGTEARRQIDALDKVLKQLQEDILPEISRASRSQGNYTISYLRKLLQNPQELQSLLQKNPNFQVNATDVLNQLRAEFSELSQHPEDVQKRINSYIDESKNIFRRTPANLEMPTFTVTYVGNGYEVRQYEPYSIISTPTRTQAVASSNPTAATRANAKAFNTLASYLFGKNEAKKSMEMTAPVEMTVDEEGTKNMAFVLPSEFAQNTPQPAEGDDITVQALPTQTVAVLEFPGFATEKEIKKQKDVLIKAIAADGDFKPVDETSYKVLQWNPPYTLPWLRRNEICIKVVPDIKEAAVPVDSEAVAVEAVVTEELPDEIQEEP